MNRITKFLVSILALALFASTEAFAGFRIARPSAAIKQQALMSIQSAGNAEEETVVTTTRENPFTVNLSELGVTDSSSASLVLVNEKTGNAISIAPTDGQESKIELPPLALAELEMQYLGANQKYRAMTVASTAAGKEEVVDSVQIASSVANVELPNFRYQRADGKVLDTHVVDRTLVSVDRRRINCIVRDPADPLQREARRSAEKAAEYYVYTYQLPNGDYYIYDEVTRVPTKNEKAGIETVQFLNFSVDVSGLDNVKNATAEEVKKAIEYACDIWSRTVTGTCTVNMSIEFCPGSAFSSHLTLADSAPPPSAVNQATKKLYVSTLVNQLVGYDLFPENYDVKLRFNCNYTDASWTQNKYGADRTYYMGLDKKAGPKQQDFVTVLLHEICHGMGFSDNIFYDEDNPNYLYNGYLYWLQVDGAVTTQYPNTYTEHLIYDGDSVASLSAVNRVKAIMSDALYWNGPNVVELNGGKPVKVYAPSEYNGGSSISHWDDEVMDSFDLFMSWQHHYAIHEVSPLEQAAMKDIGWTLLKDVVAVPAVPAGLAASQGTKVDQVDVSWKADSNANYYEVMRSTSQNGTYEVVAKEHYACTFEDKKVESGAANKYYYKVAAWNDAGRSDFSGVVMGWAKQATVLDHIEVTGSATLSAGAYADYTCTAYYSDDTKKDVTSSAEWALPYGGSYASLTGNRVTAGSLTETKSATIHASYQGKNDELVITLLPKTVEVTFVPGTHGTLSTTKKTFTVDATYGNLPVPTATDTYYDFAGWYTAENGGSKITSDTKVVGSISKLYAHWNYTHSLATLRLDAPTTVACGGSCQVKCYARYSDEAEEALTKPTKFGVALQGGGISAKDEGAVVSIVAGANASGKITVTAYLEDKTASVTITAYKPSVSVKFDAQGGSVSTASQTFTVGEKYGTLPTPTYIAHTFDGWYTAAVGGDKVTSDTICQLDVTTLFARWIYNPTLVSLVIEGPTSLASGSETTFVCKGTYNDNKILTITPKWTVTAGTIDAGGRYRAPGVTTSCSVSIDATYGGLSAPTKMVTVTPETVNVTFDPRGGTVSPNSKTYVVGAQYGELPTATRDGNWKFVGWFTALDETGVQVDGETVVDKSIVTLYAFWQAIDVLTDITITGPSSVTGGTTGDFICRAKYSNGNVKNVTPEWTISAGEAFATISPVGVLSAGETTQTRSVVVKAAFGGKVTTKSVAIIPEKVTIVFNANGGTVASPTRQYVVGVKYNEFPVANRENHRFLGWFTRATEGTRVLESAIVAKDITELFAHWQMNPPALKELAISGGKLSVVAGEAVSFVCMATFTNGVSETSQDVTGVATWMVEKAAAGVVNAGTFVAAQVTEVIETTITATYEGKSASVVVVVSPEEVTVSFDANGGSVSEATHNYVVGDVYATLPMPVKEGFDFEGWYTAQSEGMLITEASICRKDITKLFARWKEQTKLTGIVIDGPSSLVAGEEGQYVCIATYSDSTEKQVVPEWQIGDSSLGRIGIDGLFVASFVPCETNVELTASFGGKTTSESILIEPAYVSVFFDAQNGAVSPQRMEFVVGAPYGELPVPTRSKYDFAGWYTKEAKGGDLVSEESIATNTVTTLYAGWTLVSTSLTGIKIEGVGKVVSGGGAVFTCKAQYADGTTGSVVPTWSIVDGLEYASLTIGGYLTAEETDEERSVTIQAAYTEKGIRYEDQWVVTVVPASLVVDPGAMSIEATAQTCSLVVDAFDDWTISTDADWITLGTTSGSYYDTVTFTTTENTDSDERIGTITVKCGQETATCTVKQYSPIPDTYVQVQFNPCVPDQTAFDRQYVLNRKFGYLPTPVRAGYAFGGWWTGVNGSGTRVHALTVVAEDNQTLYAYWTGVTPSYALNGSLDCVADAVHPWGYDYTTSVDRKLSMVSAEISNRESTSISVLVEGRGRVSFYWKTSCEQYFDALSFYIDGKFVANISGETGWETVSQEISTYGQHVLTWTYAKDGQGTAGADCGWLDMVSWIPSYTGMASIKSITGRSLPEAWINAHGLTATETVPDEDLDGDGMTNYEEFIAGTDPTDPESKFTVEIEMRADGIPEVWAIPDLGDTLERRYIFEGKSSLNDEKWEAADETIHRFFRVRIEVQ